MEHTPVTHTIIDRLKRRISAEIRTDDEALSLHSRDTSLFSIMPKAVVYPKHSNEIKELVRSVSELKREDETLSLTSRSGGSDMTGGPLNDSLIVSYTAYMNHFSLDVSQHEITVEPGVLYRDTEKEMQNAYLVYPAFPASRGLCAWGGMVMNNAAGEKTLKYGQTREHVREVSMVLADGNEYTFGPISGTVLAEKKKENSFEGEIYRRVCDLIDQNEDTIASAQPTVTKNSSGYAIWRVWDKENDVFDLSQLFIGSQGTLGILTRARLGLVPVEPYETMVAVFLPDWKRLPDLVTKLLPYSPESLEVFDDATLKLGIRFMPEIARKVGRNLISFGLQFLPEAWIGLKMFGIPKLIMLIEISEHDQAAVRTKEHDIETMLTQEGIYFRTLREKKQRDSYWIMRRESFNLLRGHVHGKRTAPFIEDFCVAPEYIPEFLPKLLSILKEADIKANIAGHAGNGNFHIIPLMDLTQERERAKIVPVADKVYQLVISYKGTITAEHNDGIIRTPYIVEQFGERMNTLFGEIKHIFDPQNIFNPRKKIGGTKEDIVRYMA